MYVTVCVYVCVWAYLNLIKIISSTSIYFNRIKSIYYSFNHDYADIYCLWFHFNKEIHGKLKLYWSLRYEFKMIYRKAHDFFNQPCVSGKVGNDDYKNHKYAHLRDITWGTLHFQILVFECLNSDVSIVIMASYLHIMFAKWQSF